MLCFSEGSTVANVSTSYDAEYLLQTSNSPAEVSQFILNSAIPELHNITLTVNGSTIQADPDYLKTQTVAEINEGSKFYWYNVPAVVY